MDKTYYLVEICNNEGDLLGLEKFTIKEVALAFIEETEDPCTFCNLFEARPLNF